MSNWKSKEEFTTEAVDGLYCGSGFFFKQRKGRLNLRRLDSIDLTRLIREVDVDLLQQNLEDLTFCQFAEDDLQFFSDQQIVKLYRIAQLTIEYLLFSQNKLLESLKDLAHKYSTKKKALHNKRKELVGLKADVSSLQSQLKAKRRHLMMLEKLVKDASDFRAKKMDGTESASKEHFLTFFISLPNQLFLEMKELPNTTIRNLVSQAMNVILSQGGEELRADAVENQLRLFNRGKILVSDSTLEQSGIKSGDTLVASFAFKGRATASSSKSDGKGEVVVVERQSTAQTSHQLRAVREERRDIEKEKEKEQEKDQALIQFSQAITQQLVTMQQFSNEVKGCTEALSNLTKNEVDLLAKHELSMVDHIDNRLKGIEKEVKDNITRLQQIADQERARGRSGLIFGQLENDRDIDHISAMKEIHQKLQESASKMTSIDFQVSNTSTSLARLHATLHRQQEEIELLRNSLQLRGNESERVAPRTVQEEKRVQQTSALQFAVMEQEGEREQEAVVRPLVTQQPEPQPQPEMMREKFSLFPPLK